MVREIYFCRHLGGRLSIDDMRYLAMNMGCAVAEIGETVPTEEEREKRIVRGDYNLETGRLLTEEDFKYIKEKNLTVLLGSFQQERLEKTLNLTQFTDCIVGTGFNPQALRNHSKEIFGRELN